MIDFQIVDNALKQVYLGVIRDQLNNQSDPVLTKIKKTQDSVWGNKIIVYSFDGYELKEDLSTLTVTIEISDRAIRHSQNSAGVFVNLLNDEIENMLSTTKRGLISSFYTEDTKPEYLGENYKYEPMKVTGLKKIFDMESDLYGYSRRDTSKINPHIEKIDKFDPIKIQEIIDNNNDEVNMMICSPKLRRDYIQYLTKCNQPMETIEIDGGFKEISFNGSIPMHTNRSIPENEIYLINTEDFKLHQLCDWEWIKDENGRILKQDPNRPIYKATLVKYANYICYNPRGQIKILVEDK